MAGHNKWSARRITHELAIHGHTCALRTVSRWLHRLGISRREDLDPSGENNRAPATITDFFPGHMLHLEVKSSGRSPTGAGGGPTEVIPRPGGLQNAAPPDRWATPICDCAADEFSRLACTETHDDESAATTIGFFARARAFFYYPRHHRHHPGGHRQRVRLPVKGLPPHRGRARLTTSTHRPYTPRHNGKVERYQRILAQECLYARVYDNEHARRAAIGVWVNHYNYHRPRTACSDQPPATRVPNRVANIMTSYT